MQGKRLKSRLRSACAAGIVGCSLSLAACAPTVVKTGFPYRPSLDLPQGTGRVAVVAPQTAEDRRNETGEWVIGDVKRADGERAGAVVADEAPEELVMRALTGELKRAGYHVDRVAEIDGQSGLRLLSAGITVGEIIHHVTVEARAEATITAEVVRDGATRVRITYTANGAKTTVRGKGNPAEEVLESAVHDLLGQALPEILKELEKK